MIFPLIIELLFSDYSSEMNPWKILKNPMRSWWTWLKKDIISPSSHCIILGNYWQWYSSYIQLYPVLIIIILLFQYFQCYNDLIDISLISHYYIVMFSLFQSLNDIPITLW